VTLFGKVTFAAGVPTLVTTFPVSGGGNQNPSNGIASVTDVGAGLYKITLQDTYVRLLGVTVTEVAASGTASVTQVVVTDDSVASIASPYVTLKLAAADLTTTSLLITINLANSTAL
jgi:hypothetical protein